MYKPKPITYCKVKDNIGYKWKTIKTTNPRTFNTQEELHQFFGITHAKKISSHTLHFKSQNFNAEVYQSNPVFYYEYPRKKQETKKTKAENLNTEINVGNII